VTEKEAAPLKLSAEPPRRRTGYAHPIPHYCAFYETNERGIKVWLKKGRMAGDPVPLDNPVEMPAWWTRNSPQTVPEKLLRAAQRAAAAAPAASPDASAVAGSEPPSAPSSALAAPPPGPRTTQVMDDSTEGLSLVEAMPRLERMLAHAIGDYESKARDPRTDDAALQLADARLNKAIERHRKLETTLLDSAKARGDLVAVADLRPQLVAIFRRLTDTLVDDVVATFGVQRSAAVAFADIHFAHVRELPFGDLAQLPASAQARAA
jgi:hypothetical protein